VRIEVVTETLRRPAKCDWFAGTRLAEPPTSASAGGSANATATSSADYRAVNFTATVEPTEFQDLDPFGGGVLPGGVYVG
jgi:hypothetical protein